MKIQIWSHPLALVALLCMNCAFNVLAAQPPTAPAISATKRDALLVDNDGDGLADRGDRLQYTVVVSNTGSVEATGVIFSDALDANTTLISGSLQTTPLAYDGAATTAEATPVAITLTGNEFDGDTLVFTIASSAANGSLGAITPVSAVAASVTYTPAANYNGDDSFTFRVADDDGNTDTATVNITVTAVNDAPVAVADSYSTDEDMPLSSAPGSVLDNDTDADGDTLTAVLVSGPDDGNLVFNTDGTFTYTPDANFNGTDSFTYRADDGNVLSGVATVTIAVNPVNDVPVAVADSYSTDEDTTFVSAPASVLNNDNDVDGDTLTAVLVTGPGDGDLALNTNGTFTYAPDADFNGTDSFTYRASDDSSGSAPATVTIAVMPVNDAPVAVADSYSTDEDTAFVSAPDSVLDNDIDVDGDSLTAVSGAGPSNGTLMLNPNGTFTYTPAPNFNGTDSFTYRANDGNALSGPATVTISVAAVNDAPVAMNDTYGTDEETPLISDPESVLDNDTDVENHALTAILVSGPANGDLTLNLNGTFIYTPASNFSGSDTFTYRANDGDLNSNVATVTIMVNSVNDAPVANPDSFTTNENTPLDSGENSVLDNDDDPENDTLTAVLDGDPSNGTLTFNSDGTFVYTPAPNFSGTDSFTYHANDGSLNSNTTTVTITVTAVDDPPVAANDEATLIEDAAAAAIDVLDNDTDNDGGPISISSVTQPDNGGVVITSGGADLTYEPDPDYCNDGVPTDDFTYTLAPGGDTATVSVTVTCVNDAPVAVADSYSTDEDTPFDSAPDSVLENDDDVEGDSLTAVLVTGPADGNLMLNPDGTFTYTPAPNFSGTDSFTYQANDGNQDSNVATVTITVTAVDDLPVAVDDEATVIEDAAATAIDVLNNDTDIDGGPISISSVTQPDNGEVVITNGGDGLTYEPNPDYCNDDAPTDDFSYTLTPGGDTATVSVTVTCVDDPPVASADNWGSIGNTRLAVDQAALAGEITTSRLQPSSSQPAELYFGETIDIAIGTLPVGKGVTLTFEAMIGASVPTSVTEISNQAQVTGDNFATVLSDDPDTAAPSDPTVTDLDEPDPVVIFLPLVVTPGLPDLVVSDLAVSSGGVQVVVENQGTAPVLNAFWVDVYIDPSPPPTAVNQTWEMLADEGLVWAVTGAALPLDPGETVTLTIGDAYYRPSLSNFSGTLAAGTPVYAQVDSAQAGVSYGAVLENHERTGGAYNNITGPVSPATSIAVELDEEGGARAIELGPERP